VTTRRRPAEADSCKGVVVDLRVCKVVGEIVVTSGKIGRERATILYCRCYCSDGMTRTRFCLPTWRRRRRFRRPFSDKGSRSGRFLILFWTGSRLGCEAELAVEKKCCALEIIEEAFPCGQSYSRPVTTSSSARTWLAWLVELVSNSK
jgi:hypothetical protein